MPQLQVHFMCFWHGFDARQNAFTEILQRQQIEYDVVDEPEKATILFVGSFVSAKDNVFLRASKVPKVCFVTEPIAEIAFPHLKDILARDKPGVFDCVAGCVADNPERRHVKYPLYICYCADKAFRNELWRVEFQHVPDIRAKKFCTLISRHDMFQSRTNMYDALSSAVGRIDCPSNLLNNMDNAEIERAGGLVPFISRYWFNLCPENTSQVEYPGYITEKLLHACLAGAIPIYCGSFDATDALIFNRNRIIFFEQNPASISAAVRRVKELVQHPPLLFAFASQPIFLPTSYSAIVAMEENVAAAIKRIMQPS